MVFDPEIHHRRSLRLKGYDYSNNGAYFVTVCSFKKENLFSTVGQGEFALAKREQPGLAGLASAQNNTCEINLKIQGKIILRNWNKIPERFNNIIIDDIVIMPNHFYGIIIIEDGNRVDARPTPTLGDIICSFKSECVTDYIKYIAENNLVLSSQLWQRNYYEHIIRNEHELNMYRKYIQDNPAQWQNDEYFIDPLR